MQDMELDTEDAWEDLDADVLPAARAYSSRQYESTQPQSGIQATRAANGARERWGEEEAKTSLFSADGGERHVNAWASHSLDPSEDAGSVPHMPRSGHALRGAAKAAAHHEGNAIIEQQQRRFESRLVSGPQAQTHESAFVELAIVPLADSSVDELALAAHAQHDAGASPSNSSVRMHTQHSGPTSSIGTQRSEAQTHALQSSSMLSRQGASEVSQPRSHANWSDRARSVPLHEHNPDSGNDADLLALQETAQKLTESVQSLERASGRPVTSLSPGPHAFSTYTMRIITLVLRLTRHLEEVRPQRGKKGIESLVSFFSDHRF
jgi:hypothetical protein